MKSPDRTPPALQRQCPDPPGPKEEHLATIKMVAEDEATGEVKEIYRDIMESLGTDFVPNMYKAMAAKPDYLRANWDKIRTVMKGSGKLDGLTKEIIAVAVSAAMGCGY